jgi:hypothetical protein
MKIYKIAQNFPSILTSDQMINFIVNNKSRNWQGELDYDDAKNISNLVDKWELTWLPLSLFSWIADSTYSNKSLEFPPIVFLSDGKYEVLDGKHRIGMAKDRGDQQIKVYLGKNEDI